MDKCNPSTTPSNKKPQLAAQPLDKEQHSMFRTAVGQLLWVSQLRVDISFAKALQQPDNEDLKNLKQVLSVTGMKRHVDCCETASMMSTQGNVCDRLASRAKASKAMEVHATLMPVYIHKIEEQAEAPGADGSGAGDDDRHKNLMDERRHAASEGADLENQRQDTLEAGHLC
eukprot:2418728-Amphidinium_carterae.4